MESQKGFSVAFSEFGFANCFWLKTKKNSFTNDWNFTKISITAPQNPI